MTHGHFCYLPSQFFEICSSQPGDLMSQQLTQLSASDNELLDHTVFVAEENLWWVLPSLQQE